MSLDNRLNSRLKWVRVCSGISELALLLSPCFVFNTVLTGFVFCDASLMS